MRWVQVSQSEVQTPSGVVSECDEERCWFLFASKQISVRHPLIISLEQRRRREANICLG
jgi:hypothetical protein